MEQSFWRDRWERGQIPFHEGAVNQHLAAHAGAFPSGARVLVPLCGKTVDLAWLAARGHEVVGVEFVADAASAFFAERGVAPERVQVAGHEALRHAGITIVIADFFAVTAAGLGRFPALYDRAALVAIPPARRREYLDHLRGLATDDAHLLLVTMEHDLGTGPPFSVERAGLPTLGTGLFGLTSLGAIDLLDREPRFRERGATRLVEEAWLGAAEP